MTQECALGGRRNGMSGVFEYPRACVIVTLNANTDLEQSRNSQARRIVLPEYSRTCTARNNEKKTQLMKYYKNTTEVRKPRLE